MYIWNGNTRKVIIPAAEVAEFMRSYPCSGLSEGRAYWFEFDADGSLIDTDVPEQNDGPGAAALAKDAWVFLDQYVPPHEPTAAEETARYTALGQAIAELLHVKLRRDTGRYDTSYGTKSAEGLGHESKGVGYEYLARCMPHRNRCQALSHFLPRSGRRLTRTV